MTRSRSRTACGTISGSTRSSWPIGIAVTLYESQRARLDTLTLERRLDPARFLRIHRGTLLNLAWVSELHADFGAG